MEAQRQHGERGGDDEQTAAIGSGFAPAKADQRQAAEHNQSAEPTERGGGDDGSKEQRLDLVADPVEAAAAVGPRSEDGEGVQLRIDGEEHCEDDEKRPDRPCQQRQHPQGCHRPHQ